MNYHGINQESKSQSVSLAHMKRILVLLLLALFSTSVSAESYIITGQVTYSDNSPVGARDIAIDDAITTSIIARNTKESH